MKAKLVIAFVFLVMLWVSVAGVEYELVMWFGIVFTSSSAFSLYAGCLGRCFEPPKATKMRIGFIIGALADAAPL
jgi:hypothetical protein